MPWKITINTSAKNIKAFYKRRLAAPIIYLIVPWLLAWHFFSLSAVFSPDILPDDTSLETAFRGGKQYISTTLSDLKFTGYTQSIFGHTNGYYYYTMRDEECIIVLLSPNTSEEGLPSIEEVTIKGKISQREMKNFDTAFQSVHRFKLDGKRYPQQGFFLLYQRTGI